jgi:hypothetical protein
MLSGRDMPYSLLMYIWENRAPVRTVIPSTHTARQMIVAAAVRKASASGQRCAVM